jgi:hypothetical protein
MDADEEQSAGGDLEEEEWLRLGVAATLSREYAANQRQFLESVARVLETALPGHVEVERGGGLFSRQRPLKELRVSLGDHRYALSASAPGLVQARRTLVKRGIALNTEEFPVAVWIEMLCSALQEYAQHNQGAQEALKRLAG